MTYYTYEPFTVGFENLLNKLERVHANASSNAYPPHNIRKVGEDQYQIELAVAGLSKEDIEIKLDKSVLTVQHNKKGKEDSEDLIHKGISTRSFVKEFTLAEHVLVTGADLVNGILQIKLRKEVPEELKPRTIEIGEGSSTTQEFLQE